MWESKGSKAFLNNEVRKPDLNLNLELSPYNMM